MPKHGKKYTERAKAFDRHAVYTVSEAFDWICFYTRYQSFTQGIFDLTNITFFISVIAVFLFMTVRVVDRKRWA